MKNSKQIRKENKKEDKQFLKAFKPIMFSKKFLLLCKIDEKKACKKLTKKLEELKDVSWDKEDIKDTVRKAAKGFSLGLQPEDIESINYTDIEAHELEEETDLSNDFKLAKQLNKNKYPHKI